jgi:hypothetical protein
MAAQIFPDRTNGFTMFSGVFQTDQDLPYLNAINFNESAFWEQEDFNQLLSQYHSAKIPIYDSTSNVMHTIFFGGMSQFTLDEFNNLIEDQDVPFVNTISRVSRFASDSTVEFKLDINMPSLLGSGSEFIPIHNNYFNYRDICMLDRISEGKTLIGYIYGGIESTEANIFFKNDGSQSRASATIFRVYLTKMQSANTNDLAINQSIDIQLKLYPNPVQNTLNISFNNKENEAVECRVYNASNQLVNENKYGNFGSYKNGELVINTAELPKGVYFIELNIGAKKLQSKFIKI